MLLSNFSNNNRRSKKCPKFGAFFRTSKLDRKRVRTIDNIENLPNEEWRTIEGYKGKYLVSNMGRVKSLKHANARLLTAFENNKGYLRVCLSKNGKGRHFLVSRLVASAFCENDAPENKTTIDHLNHDRLDNRACNL